MMGDRGGSRGSLMRLAQFPVPGTVQLRRSSHFRRFPRFSIPPDTAKLLVHFLHKLLLPERTPSICASPEFLDAIVHIIDAVHVGPGRYPTRSFPDFQIQSSVDVLPSSKINPS